MSINLNFLKKSKSLLLLGTLAIISVFFFIPKPTLAAGVYGDMLIYAKIQYPTTTAAYNGVSVTVTSESSSTYSGSCGTGTKGTRKCNTQGMVDLSTSPDTCKSSVSGKTSGSGLIQWNNTFSSCNCTFKVNLSAPAAPAGYTYDGGWSPAEPFTTTAWGNDGTFNKTFTIKVVPKQRVDVAVSPAGSGIAASDNNGGTADSMADGIYCDSSSHTNCAEYYWANAATTNVTATANSGYRFDHWDVYYSGSNHVIYNRVISLGHSVPVSATATFVKTQVLGIGIVTDFLDGKGYVGNSSGGQVTSDNISCVPDCSETYDLNSTHNITATANSGYAFMGWSFYNTDNGVVHTAESDYNASTGLHTWNPHGVYMDRNWSAVAYFRKTAVTHTVTFDKNNASATGSMSAQTFNESETKTLTANAYSLTGYTFAGWATTSAGAVAYANQASYTMGTGNVTLYAKWNAITHTVTFDKNNASATGTMSAQTFNEGQTKALTANAYALSGYSFAGWATTSAGAVVYANQANLTMGTSNITLYAKWTALACSVTTFKANGVSSPLNITAGTSVTFALGASNATTTTFDNGDGGNQTTHIYNAGGTYTAKYSCTGLGGNDNDTFIINVANTCSINSATATPDSANPKHYVPLDVSFTGTYSTTYPDPISFLWDYGNGLSRSWNAAVGASTTYNSAGSFTAILRGRIEDGFGTSCGNKATPAIVTVNKPSCSVSPSSGLSPLTVKVVYSDFTSTPTFRMNYGGADEMVQTGKPTPFYFTYNSSGTYDIRAILGAETFDCPVTVGDGTTTGTVTVGSPNDGSGGEVKPGS